MIQFFSSGDYSWWINSWLQVIHLSFRSWSSYHILGSRGFIFLFGVPSSLNYLVAKLHLNHCKASPCVFNFSFFLSSFYYRSSSWSFFFMVVHQGFNSFSKCSQDSCWKSSNIFFLHSKVQFFLSYLLRWCYVILDNFLHVSWFTSCQEWDI